MFFLELFASAAIALPPSQHDDQTSVEMIRTILANWAEAGENIPGDLDGNNIVDENDLSLLIDTHLLQTTGASLAGPTIESTADSAASFVQQLDFQFQANDQELLLVFGGSRHSDSTTPSITGASWNTVALTESVASHDDSPGNTRKVTAFSHVAEHEATDDVSVTVEDVSQAVHAIAIALSDVDLCTPTGQTDATNYSYNTTQASLTITTSSPNSRIFGALLMANGQTPVPSHTSIAATSNTYSSRLHVQATDIVANADEEVTLSWSWDTGTSCAAVAIEVLASPEPSVRIYPWNSVQTVNWAWARKRNSLYEHPLVSHYIVGHMDQTAYAPPGMGTSDLDSIEGLVEHIVDWQAYSGLYRDNPNRPQAKGAMFFRNGSDSDKLPQVRYVMMGDGAGIVEVVWDGFTMHREDALDWPQSNNLQEDNASKVIFNSEGIRLGEEWWELFSEELEYQLESHNPPLCHPHLYLDIEHRNNRAGSIEGGNGDEGWWHYSFNDPRASTEVVFKDESGIGYTLVDLWGSSNSMLSGAGGPLFRRVDLPASQIDLTGVTHWNQHSEFGRWITDMGRQIVAYTIREATKPYRDIFPDAKVNNYKQVTWDALGVPAYGDCGGDVYRSYNVLDSDSPVLYGPSDGACISTLKTLLDERDDRDMAAAFNLRKVEAALASSSQPQPVIPWIAEHFHSRSWLVGSWGPEYQLDLLKALYQEGVRDFILWGNPSNRAYFGGPSPDWQGYDDYLQELESVLDDFYEWIRDEECS